MEPEGSLPHSQEPATCTKHASCKIADVTVPMFVFMIAPCSQYLTEKANSRHSALSYWGKDLPQFTVVVLCIMVYWTRLFSVHDFSSGIAVVYSAEDKYLTHGVKLVTNFGEVMSCKRQI